VTATAEFTELTEPFRRELLVHCYRMLGSIDEAEDLVQETLLRAWRGFDDFAGRSSLRTWLYRIATNACLTALDQRSRRPLPSFLSAPSDDPTGPLAPPRHDIPWLQPLPDPLDVVTSRADIRLAFIAALQLLPARQRAAVILRDVLEWSIPEIATLLATTPAAINSALQRARATLSRAALPDPVEPMGAAPLLDRYVTAFETRDLDTLATLLADDVTWEMPPRPEWFAGRTDVLALIARRAPTVCRLHPCTANGQPALAMYTPAPAPNDPLLHPHSLQLLTPTPTPTHIAHVVSFHTPALFPHFNLPATLPRYPVVAPQPH
jgi:RNA polymerase sigma-70 factor (ECF subfamily)